MLHDFIEYREPLVLYKDGVSSLDYNIKVLKTNILSSPQRRIEYIEIPGRDGTLSINHGWEDFLLELECVLVGDDDRKMTDIAKQAKQFLMEGTNSKLQSSEDMSFYLLGTIDNKLDINEVLENFSDNFQVIYRCKPFRYATEEETEVITASGGIINTNSECKPKIQVVCNGDITIKINSQTLSLKGVSGNVFVDCDLMDCYKQTSSGVISQNHLMYSFFPKLEKGVNNISVSSSDNNALVNIIWREVSVY